jgi:serine/threonine protein kinase
MVERVVGGAYRVGPLLASGGMGDVYEGLGPGEEPVALKFLRPVFASHPDLVTRFKREARIAARIVSPYVARVLGAGKDRDGTLWIAFERLHGEALDATIAREGRLALGEVAWIVEHALLGLAAAHAIGVVHRDIKPGNVFLEAGIRRARLLDFGVSKLREPSVETASPGLTEDDTTVGTLSFMAPEQTSGAADVDARADLYSLGVVAFVALAGAFPFRGKTTAAMVHHRRYLAPLSLREVTGAVWPAALERFFAHALAREPSERVATAADAVAAWNAASAAAR